MKITSDHNNNNNNNNENLVSVYQVKFYRKK